ncbi:MAG: hypothetical protein RBU37_21605 [Myxococcota bacterium]|nr:hypothetical protein [Myxococcota bacterium]
MPNQQEVLGQAKCPINKKPWDCWSIACRLTSCETDLFVLQGFFGSLDSPFQHQLAEALAKPWKASEKLGVRIVDAALGHCSLDQGLELAPHLWLSDLRPLQQVLDHFSASAQNQALARGSCNPPVSCLYGNPLELVIGQEALDAAFPLFVRAERKGE